MFTCKACGGTGCTIDPPSPYGEVACTKCGTKHGRFSELTASAARPPAGAEQTDRSPDDARAPTSVAARALGAAGSQAGGITLVPLGGSPVHRLLRKAPADWGPVPDYASLSSAKQALHYLEQSGLIELRYAGASPHLIRKWRLTDAGRKAASAL